MKIRPGILAAAVALAAAGAAVWTQTAPASGDAAAAASAEPTAIVAAAASQPAATATQAADAASPEMTVYTNPGCSCCHAWVEHLREHGFTVTAHETADMAGVRERLGVPAAAVGCHTGVVAGYVIEGHVPAELVEKLLDEKPADVAGIAVPGMPIGSPGMEVPGRPAEAYQVLAFGKNGKTSVYAER